MSNSLDSDQSRHFVGPDLVPNCLQSLSAGGTSKRRVKVGVVFGKVNYLQEVMLVFVETATKVDL